MKRTIKFLDALRNRAIIECEITTRNGYPEFTMSGQYGGGAGQCLDRIKPATDAQKRLIKLWEDWHLNGSSAGTDKQNSIVKPYFEGAQYDYDKACELLDQYDKDGKPLMYAAYLCIAEKRKEARDLLIHNLEVKKSIDELQAQSKWTYLSKDIYEFLQGYISKGDLLEYNGKYRLWVNSVSTMKRIKTRALNHLNNNKAELEKKLDEANLMTLLYDTDPRTGKVHKYGGTWSRKDLPESFEDDLNELLDEIEEESSGEAVTLEDIDLFQDFEDPAAALALAVMTELTKDDIEDIGEDGSSWTVQGEDYFCGDKDAMHEVCKEYIEQTLWAFNSSFIGKYGALDSMGPCSVGLVLQPLQEACEGGNDGVKALVDWDSNADQITSDAINADGIGHFLNHWDGTDDSIEVDGVTYYSCRK